MSDMCQRTKFPLSEHNLNLTGVLDHIELNDWLAGALVIHDSSTE